MIGRTNAISARSTTPGKVPSDWPDIHAIVAADVQAGYAYKYIYLLADDYTYSTFTVTATDLAFKTSDGKFYTSSTTHNWDLAQDIGTSVYKVRWVIVYSNTESLNVVLPYEVLWLDGYSTKLGNTGYQDYYRLRAIDGTFQTGFTSAESMFAGCLSLTRVPDTLDLSSCTNTSSMFASCSSLTRVPDTLDLSSCTNTSSMFAYCSSLTRVPDIIDLSSCTNTSSMFDNCLSLTRVPDTLDLSSCTNMSDMFYNCLSLTRLPQMIIATASGALVAPSFEYSTRVNADYKDTVATFDGGGVVNGGMVYNLATVTKARALTLNSIIKKLFTGAEQTAIANNLTGKNWSLVW